MVFPLFSIFLSSQYSVILSLFFSFFLYPDIPIPIFSSVLKHFYSLPFSLYHVHFLYIFLKFYEFLPQIWLNAEKSSLLISLIYSNQIGVKYNPSISDQEYLKASQRPLLFIVSFHPFLSVYLGSKNRP